MKNYYEILGVSQTSDEETITAAFKALMQKLDSGAHSATAGKDNTKDFNDVYAVLKAYEVLIDPDARREYDASLAKAKPQDVPPPTPKIPVVVEEEEVFVFPSANAFTEQQPSRWNTKIWLLPVLLLGFFLIYQIIQSKNSADPNAIVTVTVTGTANIRDAASSSGTSVLGEYPPGTTLRGRWVPGNLNPSEQWLELEEGGRFVWGRNLLEVEASVLSDAAEIAPPPAATKIEALDGATKLKLAFEAATRNTAPYISKDGSSGSRFRISPLKLLKTDFGYALITGGDPLEDFHSAVGYIKVYYLDATDVFELKSSSGEIFGGFGYGELPEWKISYAFSSNPAVLVDGGYFGMGCGVSSQSIVVLTPGGPVETDVLLSGSNDGFGGPYGYEGKITNIVKNSGFDVQVTGTRSFSEHYSYKNGKFKLTTGASQIPSC
ncbi:J domain-containing protein [Sphingorhabdus sp.]|jgi:hypothetical protein|uniref:J domain-containing protein n=1 Tax=Sphingorhabdus sp. TaxID=1902408 RepID=UPI0037839F61